jgi:uncharacterized protein (DUF58 family)
MDLSILKKIRAIEIETGRLANEAFTGRYQSVFRGHGLEFHEVRDYSPGDDIRSIDWNVTARSGKLHVKVFQEERSLSIMILVDASRSLRFGTKARTKQELAAEITALLAVSAIKNHDAVGLLIFTDTVECFIPPRRGTAHVFRLIHEMLAFRPQREKTDIQQALAYFYRVVRKNSVVFLLSDFIGPENYWGEMRQIRARHDLIAVSLYDPWEITLPPAAFIQLSDSETGEEILIDGSDPLQRRAHEASCQQWQRDFETRLRSVRVDLVRIGTGQDPYLAFMDFFGQRLAKTC